MKKKSYILVLFLLTLGQAIGQTLNKGEYFFDADPGTGNGTSLTITPSATINTNFAINIDALSIGFHNLNIRLRDNTGKWSHFQSRTFYLAPLSSLSPPSVNVTKAEYFFDNDPGLGSGTNVPITPTASLNQNIVVPITSLTPGFHNLNFRVKDDKNKWSHFASRTFYIVPPPAIANSVTITKAEYFFDNDPGTGLATGISVTTAGQINQNIVVPITSLSPGFHNLNFRVRDDKGRWSHFASRTFYIVPPPATPVATAIKKAEYFFDTDPGTGLATPLTLTSGNPQDNSFAIDISSLAPGFHRLAIRYQDNQNHWSHFAPRTFYLLSGNALGANNLTRVEYFIDTDPDANPALSGTVLPITPSSSINQLYAIDLGSTPQGNHILYVRAKDDKGFWSSRAKTPFTVLACTPPTAPTATGDSRCDSGTLTLTATGGATGLQVYRWYDDPVLNNLLSTGPTYTTPSITASKDYYVSVYDPSTLCESTRTTVSATINIISKPSLNTAGTLTLCEGSSYTLSAPLGFASYVWSNGLTTQEIKVNTNGNYSVSVSDGACSSIYSDEVTVIFSPKPTKPIIQTSGSTSLCDGAAVTLTAPAGFTYVWSTGATSQEITVNASGSYTVSVADGSNCPSDLSDAVVVEAFAKPTKPSIDVVGNTALCDTNTIGLLGPSGFSVYQWSSGQTTQSITVGTAGDYTLIVGNDANCLSPTSDAVTISAKPTKPIIQTSGSTSLCDGASVTLTAPAGFTYVWSTGETSQEITVSTAGSYTVSVSNGSSCTSDLSDAVVVSAFTKPTKPSIEIFGSTALCGTNTVGLLAPSGFTIYQWSGGQTTQGITVAAAGSHSLIVGNTANCLSPASDVVTVTSTNQPCTGGGTPNSPPSIDNKPLAGQIESKVTIDLTKLVSDPDNNINFSTLRIINSVTSRGAPTSISSTYELLIDYTGLPFTGVDRITLEVCDLEGVCAQQVIDIDVVGEVVVYNGITPDGDGLNDILLIKYVDVVEGAAKNKVTIYNRWGDVVFDIDNYDNLSRVFSGQTNSGKDLNSGTYFYKMDFSNGKSITGFITLKR